MFEQSIENYIALCAKAGKKPDKEFKGTFNVRIPPELHKKAAMAAAEQKITLNQYVTKAISRSFAEADNNVKETIVYIPYSTQKIDWNAEPVGDFSAYYNDGLLLTKKEKVSYVGS